MIGVGLVGYGYWGPNLARNFSARADCEIMAICDTDRGRAETARKLYPRALVTDRFAELLDHRGIDAVLIATPVSSHFELARAALRAGKDVLVEKPLSGTVEEARELVEIAAQNSRIIAVDHTFLFTGAVQKIKEIVDSGELGEILYVDSVRINLGLFQNDVNVLYDLAPHDLTIMSYLISESPIAVSALGKSHTVNNIENVAYLHFEFASGLIAHFHLNWLAPVKIRRTLIGGTKKMIVYDDMEPSEKVKIYDKGIVMKGGDKESVYKVFVDYRVGDMVAPKLATREALAVEADEFIACIASRRRPVSDGEFGLKITRLLEAAQTSLNNGGQRVALEANQ